MYITLYYYYYDTIYITLKNHQINTFFQWEMPLMSDSISLSSRIFLARRWAHTTRSKGAGADHPTLPSCPTASTLESWLTAVCVSGFSPPYAAENANKRWFCKMCKPRSTVKGACLSKDLNYIEYPSDVIDLEKTQPPAKPYKWDPPGLRSIFVAWRRIQILQRFAASDIVCRHDSICRSV